jgi:hypothetical protein
MCWMDYVVRREGNTNEFRICYMSLGICRHRQDNIKMNSQYLFRQLQTIKRHLINIWQFFYFCTVIGINIVNWFNSGNTDNIKMNLNETEWDGVKWIYLPLGTRQWRYFMTRLTKLQALQNVEQISTKWRTTEDSAPHSYMPQYYCFTK